MSTNPKRQTGVSFEPHVIAYLDRISRLEKRSRSSLVNLIVEEHAERHGTPIDPEAAPMVSASGQAQPK